jgi:type I restriction enzyme, S subunit
MSSSQRLDQLVDITMGQAPKGESYNTVGEGLPLIAGASDFGDFHPVVKKFTTSPGKSCSRDDIVLGIRATIGEKVVADRDYCLGRGVAGLRPKAGVAVRYLWHWLTHSAPVLAAKARGATFKQVNREDIGELRISPPTLSEQRRIAQILDTVDVLRARRRAALVQLEDLTQSIFLDMFGNPTTILERWPTARLGDLLDFLTSGSRGWAGHYSDSGALFLRIQNVGRGRLTLNDKAYVTPPDTGEARRTLVAPGDVLLSITADLGRTAVVPEGLGPTYVNQHLAILRTTRVAPHYLSAYISSPVGQRQVSGRNRQGVKAGLNFDDVRSLMVPMPPIERQRDFVSRVAVAEGLQAKQSASLTALDALFASLQHRAFRGEL